MATLSQLFPSYTCEMVAEDEDYALQYPDSNV